MNSALRVCLGSLSLAALAVPTGLSAQLDLQTSPVPRYHLVQLAVESETISAEEFASKTEAIRSCRDAKNLAEEIGAEMKRNRFVLSTRLPKDLQAALKDLPAGHATQVYPGAGSTLQVIVLCNVA